MAKKKKNRRRKRQVRAEFRKGYDEQTRQGDLTRQFRDAKDAGEEETSERVSGKGRLTRKRTVSGAEIEETSAGFQVILDVDVSECIPGTVLRVHGLATIVETDERRQFRCATRGLLKNLATDLQHVVVAGDRVMIKPENDDQAVIYRVEPRRRVLSRTSRGRQQIIAANVDQMLIVCTAAEPTLKPNLVDRFLITAEKSEIQPIICINKMDLVNPADLQPVIGVWAQMGYCVLTTSVVDGRGIGPLKQVIRGKDSVVAGQSGVGKSSILNAIQPGLELRVGRVSSESQKGRHTTTSAEFIPLDNGGHIVDTPGIRQFQLWDVIAEEVEGYFRDIRPFINGCRYTNCTHIHESDCAVKDAVADAKIDARRYESYALIYEENIKRSYKK